jgi:hypothetical protein
LKIDRARTDRLSEETFLSKMFWGVKVEDTPPTELAAFIIFPVFPDLKVF